MNPETGRWLSKDPIGISGGLNLYTFCGNNPVNFTDPLGLTDFSQDETEALKVKTKIYEYWKNEPRGFQALESSSCLDESGNLLRTYVWGPGIDNLLAFTDHTASNTYTSLSLLHCFEYLSGQVPLSFGLKLAHGLPLSISLTIVRCSLLYRIKFCRSRSDRLLRQSRPHLPLHFDE